MGTRLLIFLVLLGLPMRLEAGERRVALLVGHPLGGERLVPLRYVENDLARMRDVLVLLGGFRDEDVVVSYREDARDLRQRFVEVKTKLQGAGDERTLFLFYYSGHAQDGALRLDDSTVPLREVKHLVESSGAEVRLALLDACRTGGITRLKGAQKSEPILLDVDDARAQAGQVLIAASSEDEDAQESDAIQGSFFTYFLTTGLRGAADDNEDGNVTLSEAYAFAYANTVVGTIGTRGGIQHPTYRFDLRGAGDVVLSRLSAPSSGIQFPPQASGEFVVFDRDRSLLVAEFLKGPERPAFLALAPGRYVVKKREEDHLRQQELEVRTKGAALVDPSRMRRIELGDDQAKGRRVSAEEVLYGRLGVEVSLAVGPQRFLSSPARAGYFPDMTLAELRLDLHNLLRRGIGVRFDVGSGSSGPTPLVLEDPYLGTVSHRIEMSSVSSGVALTGEVPLTSSVALEMSGRLGLVFMSRAFVGEDLAPQHFSTFIPGLGAALSVSPTSWLRLGLEARLHYMFFNVDESMSLLFVDGGAFVAAVLR